MIEPTHSFQNALIEILGEQAFQRAKRTADETSEVLAVIVSRLGLLSDDEIATLLAKCTGFPLFDLNRNYSSILSDAVTYEFQNANYCALLQDSAGQHILAEVSPLNEHCASATEFATEEKFERKVISLANWQTVINANRQSSDGFIEDEKNNNTLWESDLTRLRDVSDDAPIIKRTDRLLSDAVALGASDIHVEPSPNASRVRFRVDGKMRDPDLEPLDFASKLSSRMKVICGMDVADTRRPQDGRATIVIKGRPYDLRVSTIPTSYGESLVIRILNRSAELVTLGGLGLSNESHDVLLSALSRSRGIVLVTGPTGSGKTTTLYAALNHLRQKQQKILTIEDPIEYFFEDINQVQVNPAAGITFASALRSFLRQDPDIILIGEIRDEETARIAMQAALTGHLVLATLHTNDAVSAITRLKDMGVEDYLIASTLSAIFAQRLIPKICKSCGGNDVACTQCGGGGRFGRCLISEAVHISSEIREAIRSGDPEDKILEEISQKGFVSLAQDGMRRVLLGEITQSEMLSIVGQTNA